MTHRYFKNNKYCDNHQHPFRYGHNGLFSAMVSYQFCRQYYAILYFDFQCDCGWIGGTLVLYVLYTGSDNSLFLINNWNSILILIHSFTFVYCIVSDYCNERTAHKLTQSAPTGPIIKATLTNVTLPNTRGRAFALFNIFDDLGKGLGPYFVSLLSVKFGGRLPAFNIGVFGWILCGLTNLTIFFTVVRDERMVQTTLATAQVNVV